LISLLPERKRQFAKPPLKPIRLDVREGLTVHPRCGRECLPSSPRGGGMVMKTADNPMKPTDARALAFANGAPMLGADEARDALPLQSGER
jgi:hypothetical protein